MQIQTQSRQREIRQYTFHTPSRSLFIKDSPMTRIMHEDCAVKWQSNPYNFYKDGDTESIGVKGTAQCCVCYGTGTGKGVSDLDLLFMPDTAQLKDDWDDFFNSDLSDDELFDDFFG